MGHALIVEDDVDSARMMAMPVAQKGFSAATASSLYDARRQIALYRIPSLIGATASVLLAYWAALAFLPRRPALLAAALYGAGLMLSAEAHLAKTDALLAACATASLGALARVWLAAYSARLPPPSAGEGACGAGG